MAPRAGGGSEKRSGRTLNEIQIRQYVQEPKNSHPTISRKGNGAKAREEKLVRAPCPRGWFIGGFAVSQAERIRIGVQKQTASVLIATLQDCPLGRCTARRIVARRTTFAAAALVA